MTSKESEGSVEKLRKYLKGRREEEILERLLEKQQDDFTKQLNEATKDYVARLKMLEKEKSELKIEATMWKDMYFNDHEAAQEVEGFQAHELTKLKQTVKISLV